MSLSNSVELWWTKYVNLETTSITLVCLLFQRGEKVIVDSLEWYFWNFTAANSIYILNHDSLALERTALFLSLNICLQLRSLIWYIYYLCISDFEIMSELGISVHSTFLGVGVEGAVMIRDGMKLPHSAQRLEAYWYPADYPQMVQCWAWPYIWCYLGLIVLWTIGGWDPGG